MGNQRGRLCLIHQITVGEDELNYHASSRIETKSGTILSIEELQDAVSEILDVYKTDRLEVALKQILSKEYGISGICAKSFPRLSLTDQILNKLHLCLGGFNGDELVHLPYPGTLFEQPNLFVEAYYIYRDELANYRKYKDSMRDDKNKHST